MTNTQLSDVDTGFTQDRYPGPTAIEANNAQACRHCGGDSDCPKPASAQEF